MGRVHTSKKDRHGAPGDSTSPPPIPHPEVGWPLRFWITRPLDVDSPNLAILGGHPHHDQETSKRHQRGRRPSMFSSWPLSARVAS